MPITTILLDMDDTLLTSNMRRFIPAYLEKMAHALADFAPRDILIKRVYRATAMMQANSDPTVTNDQAFRAAFVPHLDGSAAEIQRAVDHFYTNLYPTLKSLTTPRPEARPLVRHLFEAGYKVIIATQPVYPRAAIEQRLAWAGVLDFPYRLITCQENMHFTKPSPRYYREILEITGSKVEESMMVGDNPKNDILPASELGLQTWWILNDDEDLGKVPCTYQGSLAAFYEWVME